MLVMLDVGSQILVLGAIFDGLGTQSQEYQPDGYKGQLPETLKADMLTCSMVQKNLIYGGVGGGGGHKNGNHFLLDISY